jgi:mono/diheme cytochrome c family protein
MRCMTTLKRSIGLALVPLTVAACSVSDDPDFDERATETSQALPVFLSPIVTPPVIRTPRPFVTLIDQTTVTTTEQAIAVVPLLGGLQGYAVAFRRDDPATGTSRSFVTHLSGSGASAWSRPFALPADHVITDLQPYQDPTKGAGFAVVGYTAPGCTDTHAPTCSASRGFIQKLTGTGAALSLRYFAGNIPGSASANLPAGTHSTRLHSVVQRPDGALIAVGETNLPGTCLREPGYPFGTKREGTGMAYVVLLRPGGESGEAAICWEPNGTTSYGASSLHGVTVLSGNDRFYAVGWKRSASARREALVLTVATSGSQISLSTGARYGSSSGDTEGLAITRVSDRDFAIAGKTSAFDVNRTGTAGFLRQLRDVRPIGGYADVWTTADAGSGRYLSAPSGWRLFGGSAESRFSSVVSTGGRLVAAGEIAFPWTELLLDNKLGGVALPSAFVVSVDATTGSTIAARSLPPPGPRTYEGGFDGAAATMAGGTVATGWGRAVAGQRTGNTRILLSQLDASLGSGDGFSAAPPPAATPAPVPEPHPGKAVFEEKHGGQPKCTTCHGANLQGGAGPCLLGVTPSCARMRVTCGSSNQNEFGTSMPAYHSLLPKQIDDVVDYVSTFEGTCNTPRVHCPNDPDPQSCF